MWVHGSIRLKSNLFEIKKMIGMARDTFTYDEICNEKKREQYYETRIRA